MIDNKTLEEYNELREEVLMDSKTLLDDIWALNNCEKNLQDSQDRLRSSNSAFENYKNNMDKELKMEVERINQHQN